jgi:phage terminase small subunit
MTAKLTAKQKKAKPRPKAGHPSGSAQHRIKLFVEALLSNGENVTQAAVAAGFSPKSAASQGSRLLKNVKVRQIIDSRRTALVAKYELTTDMIVRSIVQELTFDPAKLYDESGNLRKITDLPEDVRMALSSIEFEQVGSPDAPVFVRKVKWAARLGAREQAMKHLGMFEKDNSQRSPLDGLPREVLKLIHERLLGSR